MFTVYRRFDENILIFWAAAGIYGFNVFIRLAIGLNELFNPPTEIVDGKRRKMTQWARMEDGTALVRARYILQLVDADRVLCHLTGVALEHPISVLSRLHSATQFMLTSAIPMTSQPQRQKVFGFAS